MKIPKTFVPEKNLEEKTKELVNACNDKYPLMEKMLEINPKRNEVFTALDELKSDYEIKKFYKEYISWMKVNGKTEEIRNNAKEVVDGNIRYILGYYGGETEKRWSRLYRGGKEL